MCSPRTAKHTLLNAKVKQRGSVQNETNTPSRVRCQDRLICSSAAVLLLAVNIEISPRALHLHMKLVLGHLIKALWRPEPRKELLHHWGVIKTSLISNSFSRETQNRTSFVVSRISNNLLRYITTAAFKISVSEHKTMLSSYATSRTTKAANRFTKKVGLVLL